jgi:CheY-like chemotaxis protein
MLVERIVRNLLGNAIKYTREGGVLLACRCCGGASGAWRIQVWDTGPGIAAADRERVFEEFFQLNPSGRGLGSAAGKAAGQSRDGSPRMGLGLGLSIVRRLSQLLGHSVSLESRLGRGTCLTLDLPATADPVPTEGRAVRETTSLAGLHVGVIDDETDVRESMRVLLERWGCVVTTGASAEELLARAVGGGGAPLQALVVDYQLREGRTGIEAIATVRDACAAELPALIVSGVSATLRLAELQASGFDWLIKPVPPERLQSWLVHAMQIHVSSPSALAAES